MTHFIKPGLMLIIFTIGLATIASSQEVWTDEMEIYTYKGGGKNPANESLKINNSGGILINRDQLKKDTIRFSVTQAELNELLRNIEKYHFKGMRSGRTEVTIYDKPSTQIRFKWDKKTNDVSIGAKSAIVVGSLEDFNSLYNYLKSFAAKKKASGK